MPCTDSLVFVVFLLFLSFHPLVASSDDRRRSKLEAIPPSPTAGCMRSNTTTHRIVDPDGRERYFHGVNVVVKGPPWHPELNAFNPLTSFVEKDMKTLQDLGLNAIRYGMMWPGAEPEKGVFNESYFNLSKTLINTAATYGIYSLLDMHQDDLSNKFCGEGIPDWAVDTGDAHGFPWPLDSPYQVNPNTGYPTDKDCAKHSWPDYQFSEAPNVAYQKLYNDTEGVQAYWTQFWGKVAQEFANNPYILGYELINEPWAGDVFAHPTLLIPGVADRENLAPVYEVLNKEIRKYDECHSIYFESVTWDELEVGFQQPPGGPTYANRSVLSYHFYVPPQISVDVTFAERKHDLERLGCAGFLTEFGIGNPDVKTMDTADEYLQSWLGWEYKPYVPKTVNSIANNCGMSQSPICLQGSGSSIWNNNGTMNMGVVNLLSRTYAQAVAGVTSLMRYDQATSNFTLKYHTTAACDSLVTEVYLNKELHYKNGYSVSLEPQDAASWKVVDDNHIQVTHSATLPEGTPVELQIKPN